MKSRQYFLDWIRVIAFGILIFYHSGMFFVSWGWHVKNNEIVNGHKIWMELVNPWRLSLLFFISGVGVSFAMKSRTAIAFISERNRRLLIPLIFGMLVIVPPQIYFERLQSHQNVGSYADFYPSVFSFIPYPEGNLSWNHLWFVVYLWVYSLVATPIFVWLRKQNFTIFNESPNKKDYYKLFIFILPLALTYWLLKPHWKITHNLTSDWYNLTISFLFFMYGYFLGTQNAVWENVEKHRKYLLFIPVFLMISSKTYDAVFGAIPENAQWILILNGILKTTIVWCVILGICGFAKHHLNFNNSFVNYANKAVYPFYILHQTITVTLGFYLAESPMNANLKFLILVLGTFGFSWLIYHFLIRPFGVMKLLFGVK
jgi:glucans biosynthesis protein C